MMKAYEGHALRLDRKLDPHASPMRPGPFLCRLQSFGAVIGAAFGAYAEGGPNVTKLLEIAAPAVARKTWASAGARSPEEYTRTIRQHLYSRWGIAAARARAIAHRSYFNMAYDPDPRADDNRRTRARYRAEREKFYYAASMNDLNTLNVNAPLTPPLSGPMPGLALI